VPMVFAGDEIGLEGVNGEDSRRTMPWDDPVAFRTRTRTVYAELAALHRAHVALRRGGLRWVHVGAEKIGYLREHPDETLLVLLSRDGSSLPEVDGVARAELLLTLGEGVAPKAQVWSVAR